MSIIDYFTITTIISACTAVLGWWLKSRLDNSIKHDYDKLIEGFRSELKRSDVLLTERLAAFKSISSRLLSLRRYCHARSAEFRNDSEFEPRTEALTEQENVGLLIHHENITRCLESMELFISPISRKKFEDLFAQMTLGFNLELWLVSDDPAPEIVVSAHELYDLVGQRVNDVMGALYSDLGLPENLTGR